MFLYKNAVKYYYKYVKYRTSEIRNAYSCSLTIINVPTYCYNWRSKSYSQQHIIGLIKSVPVETHTEVCPLEWHIIVICNYQDGLICVSAYSFHFQGLLCNAGGIC